MGFRQSIGAGVACIGLAMALTACHDDKNVTVSTPEPEPGVPTGIGHGAQVKLPTLSSGEQPVVDSDLPQTNNNDYAIAYSPVYDPMLQILKGFNKIYLLGQPTWSNDGSSTLKSGSPDGSYGYTGVAGGASKQTNVVLNTVSFANTQILNKKIWEENFNYVKTLTRRGQSKPDADRARIATQRDAYLDDQREKGYSITSGLGPLAPAYRTGADSVTTLSKDSQDVNKIDFNPMPGARTTFSITDPDHLIASISDGGSGGTNYGRTGHKLDAIVTLLNTIADYGASTEAPKYHFESPRPWRIEAGSYQVASFNGQDKSALQKLTCYDPDGTAHVEYFEEPRDPLVRAITGLKCSRRAVYTDNGDGTYSSDFNGTGQWISSRAKDGAFPSGHTAEAYDRSFGIAYAIPQRYAEMIARAGALGENRIVAGMHSPLDVIGGRIMGEAVAAAALHDPDDQTLDDNAVTQAEQYFSAKAQAAGYDTTEAWAESQETPAERNAMKARYKAFLTYGLSTLDEPGNGPVVPKGAAVLLRSRFPYLNTDQRRAILASTEIASNYPVIDESHGWGRLNLVAAAYGYGAFNGDVDVSMDGTNASGFNARDAWQNDISGKGRLRKDGSGTLELNGDNRYSGGTLLVDGTLIAGSAHAFGTDTFYQRGGTLRVAIPDGKTNPAKGRLQVSDLVQKSGTLALDLADHAAVDASRGVFIDGGTLELTVPTISKPVTYIILTAHRVSGRFTSATAEDADGKPYKVSLDYGNRQVNATVQPQS